MELGCTCLVGIFSINDRLSLYSQFMDVQAKSSEVSSFSCPIFDSGPFLLFRLL